MNAMDISSLFELNYLLQNIFFEDLGVNLIIPEGMKDTHIKALIIIKFAKEKLTMKEISKGLNMVKGAFTPVSNRLLAFEYIEKVKSTTDKRVTYLELTEKGEGLISEILMALLTGIQTKLSVLTTDEQEAYLAAVKFVLNTTKKIQNHK